MLRALYRREQSDDKQKLSMYNSDTFVGHGTYKGGSPTSTVKNTSASVAGKMKYIDSDEPFDSKHEPGTMYV